MEDFLDQVGSRLPTLRGIKFTSPDLHQLGRCVVHSNGKYSILYGCDQVCIYVQAWSLILGLFCIYILQQLLGALVLGCTSAVGRYYTLYEMTCTCVADGIANSCSQYIQLYRKAQQPYVGSCSSQRHGDGSCGAEEVTGGHQVTGEIRYIYSLPIIPHNGVVCTNYCTI